MHTLSNSIHLDPLSQPVGALAAWIDPAHAEDSVQAIARELATLGHPVMPIAANHVLIGAVSESTLLEALGIGTDKSSAVSVVMDPAPPTILVTALGSEALREMSDRSLDWMIVVDQRREPVGIVTPSRLFEIGGSREFHGKVGGMATPFGVYLTNGIVSGGASKWALVATGALMSLIFHLAGYIVIGVQNILPLSVQNSSAFLAVAQASWMVIFFICLRLLPLSGTHGAEHMVVHAIERGEELKPDIVSRMPRVHPRCGTNLAVGAMLFLGIMSATVVPDTELRLLIATLTTLLLWQPLGAILQKFVTTKKPNDRQLLDAIGAGQQFLGNAGQGKIARPSILSRLAMSGLFQVLAGGMAVALAFAAVYEVLRVPLEWRVS